MFQDFESRSDPSHGPERLAKLRAELARRGLDGFLVPLADEYQGEYIPPSAQRLAWLTGFTGSAGLCAVLADRAAVFVDGRYTIQVRGQIDPAAFEARHLVDDPVSGWLAAALPKGARLGVDPWLHTVAELRRLEAALAEAGADLVRLADNPLDAVWTDRPAPPLGAVSLHADALAGETAGDKIARIGKAIAAARADAAVLTSTDSIAWTFNIRGSDVAHTPVPLAFAILRADGRPQLFVDGRKLSNTVRAGLEAIGDVVEPASFAGALDGLGLSAARVLVDPKAVAAAIADRLIASGARLVEGDDPVVLPKATKNAAELSGTRTAHLRDGAAMVRFLAWLDANAAEGGLDEVAVARKLEEFRAATGMLKEISFDTISAAGPHAAIPHYRVSTASNLPLRRGEIFLIDSGAQYEDGTTDITRTVIVGEPTAEMRDRYTRVLKGMIAISMARFPKGTTGAHLDVLARQALWSAGLDFDHGTGHGVGVYLSVHEGPQRISKASHVPLLPGMILSNEPGYYKDGAWGIRIENLVIVTEAAPLPGGERPMMGFETLTFAPIDTRLVEPSLMTDAEIGWLDAYHAEVASRVGPLVEDADALAWLSEATRPLGRP
ncbi:aminopeptidase P family protein [Methylobrevis pamukkalensis]|uniref:Putative peptidase n=1 Tax=Methylobrevis pamukkalensis TaxID=1439726 RepID=A0A1E3GYU3_9HYPH|nr:aminopeptidase P family protein [Methylobrevis pamukkalensis]ODN69238.1 putative peptidase [Methylobrevis pamukkalensis]